MLAHLVLLAPSLAWAVDADQDGDQPPFDRNDSVASVHPNAQEVTGNHVDEDCDGIDSSRRPLAVPLFPAGPWSDSGAVTRQNDDMVTVGNASQQQAGSTWRDFQVPVPKGTIHTAIDVESVTGQGCKAVVISGRTGSADIVVNGPITQAGTLQTGALTKLVDPSTHNYNIADIAPHPTVADLIAVAPQLDAAAWTECMELDAAGSASVGCPDVPEPLVMQRAGAIWTEASVHADLPPSLVGTSIAWGEKETKLFYGTEGAGAWRTNASW